MQADRSNLALTAHFLCVRTGAEELDVQRVFSPAVVGSAGEDGIVQSCTHVYDGQNAGVDGTCHHRLLLVPV